MASEKVKELEKRYNRLFFRIRKPKIHLPMEYKKPQDIKEYELALHREGFISKVTVAGRELTQYPTLQQDLSDLEEHLLPTFWEFNQKSLHYQNRFYFYQWIFMWGAFITTFLGAITTYAYTLDSGGSITTRVFGILTAIVSAGAAYFNVLSEQGSPQKRWTKSRRLTEELRTTYYTYLAHVAPFDTTERLQEMRRLVLAIRRKENENV